MKPYICFLMLAAVMGFGKSSWAYIPLDKGTPEEIVQSIETIVANKKVTPEISLSLIRALESEKSDVHVKERAAWALGQMEIRSGTPALIQAAHHKSLIVRSAAFEALFRLRAQAALPVFLEAAQNDPILILRQRATIALGFLKSDGAIPVLVQLAQDPREEIRGAAALAMAATQSKANDFTQVLDTMTADASNYVSDRARLGLAMARRKSSDVKKYLNGADADLRLYAALYFHLYGAPSDRGFIQSLLKKETDKDVLYELKKAEAALAKRAKPPAPTASKKKSSHKQTTTKKNPTPKPVPKQTSVQK